LAINSETLTVSSAAVGITAAELAGQPDYAFITVEGAAIRFWVDGTDPTATVGHPAENGGTIELFGDELVKFRAIRRDGVNATLSISLGRSRYF